jgi:hypothetical protein
MNVSDATIWSVTFVMFTIQATELIQTLLDSRPHGQELKAATGSEREREKKSSYNVRLSGVCVMAVVALKLGLFKKVNTILERLLP